MSTATVAVWRLDRVEVVAPAGTAAEVATSSGGVGLPPHVKPSVAASFPAAASWASEDEAIRYSPGRTAARTS